MRDKFRFWLAHKLRIWADRIDYEHAFVRSGFSFGYKKYVGAVVSKPGEPQVGAPLYHRPFEVNEKSYEVGK